MHSVAHIFSANKIAFLLASKASKWSLQLERRLDDFILAVILRKQTSNAAVQKRYSFCEELHGFLSGYVSEHMRAVLNRDGSTFSDDSVERPGTFLCRKKRRNIRTRFYAPYFTWYSTPYFVYALSRIVHYLKGVLFAIMFVILLARFLFIWRRRIRHGGNCEPGDELRVANSDSSEH